MSNAHYTRLICYFSPKFPFQYHSVNVFLFFSFFLFRAHRKIHIDWPYLNLYIDTRHTNPSIAQKRFCSFIWTVYNQNSAKKIKLSFIQCYFWSISLQKSNHSPTPFNGLLWTAKQLNRMKLRRLYIVRK